MKKNLILTPIIAAIYSTAYSYPVCLAGGWGEDYCDSGYISLGFYPPQPGEPMDYCIKSTLSDAVNAFLIAAENFAKRPIVSSSLVGPAIISTHLGVEYERHRLFIQFEDRPVREYNAVCKKCAPGAEYIPTPIPSNPYSFECRYVVNIDRRPPRSCKKNPQGSSFPIHPIIGNETYSLNLGPVIAGHNLAIYYDSTHALWTDPPPTHNLGQMGTLWWNNMERQLIIAPHNVQAIRPGGESFNFEKANIADEWSAPPDQQDSLSRALNGDFIYYNQESLIQEIYSTSGSLKFLTKINGTSLKINTNSETGKINTLTDPFDRLIKFSYKTTSRGVNVVEKIVGTGSRTITFNHSISGLLNSVTWEDGTTRSFIYDSPHLNQTWALTGIVDERNKRHATITYHPSGWAKSSEAAGGVAKSIINYTTPPQPTTFEYFNPALATLFKYREWTRPTGTTVTQPNGDILGLSATYSVGIPVLEGYSQPAGAGCAASTSNITYDTRGNIDSQDDFNGKRVCYGYEAVRNFEAVRIEGLNGSTSGTTCSAALNATDVSTLAPEARKITTEWHPDWKLETRRAEPGKITTWIYNGQPDPFNGGATAACTSPMYGASSVDPLPDGKPIAVLCKQVVQSTTDATGSQGFAAPLQAADPALPWTVTSRTTSYTYNQYGQVLTSTDERSQITTYTYYDATTTAYTKGDLWKVSNALGHITEYTHYNPHGQVLQAKDPNGVVTSYTYDLRQRLTSVTQAGQLTQIDWWPTGLLKKVTQPDGSWLLYAYDDAHRLTGISDNLGNAVTYELDNAGNRKKEQVKDPSGALTLQIDRNYDALNRLWKTSTGAPL